MHRPRSTCQRQALLPLLSSSNPPRNTTCSFRGARSANSCSKRRSARKIAHGPNVSELGVLIDRSTSVAFIGLRYNRICFMPDQFSLPSSPTGRVRRSVT